MTIPYFSNAEIHGNGAQDQGGIVSPFNPLYFPMKLAIYGADKALSFAETAVSVASFGGKVSANNISDEEIIEMIDSYGDAGETVEAERQRRIQKINPVFNEAIEQSVIAVQPFFYGVRLDGNDPAKNVESLITQGDFKEAIKYGEMAGKIFGYSTATAIGAVAAVTCFLGFIHAGVSMNAVGTVDTFTASAAAASTGMGGLMSVVGAGVLSTIAFLSGMSLAPMFAKKAEAHYQFAFISRYVAKMAEVFSFEIPTKDSRVGFSKKRHELNRYINTLSKRVGESRRYRGMKLPTVRLGMSTGEFRDAGLQDGLEKGTPLEVAVNDLYMNFAILGGTGSGKTSSILAPVIRQLFIHRRSGAIGLFGMYVSDAKGVFYVDIKQIALEEGLPLSDIIVIGTGNDQYGVHLTKGVPPELLPALISSIMATVEGGSKGGGGSAFYEGMFNIVATHIAVLLDAYDRSPAGSRFTATEHRSIYCIERMYEMLTNEPALETMIKDLLTEVEQAGNAAKFFSKAAADAVDYFNGPWQDIEADTKSNLKATVQKNLGGLMSNPAIKARFFEGRDNILLRDTQTGKILRDDQGNPQYLDQFDIEGNQLRFVDVDGAFKGKLVCSSLSSEKGGVGASFAISALSARVKMISTDREIDYKSYNDTLASAKASLKVVSSTIKKAVGLADVGFDDDLFADLAVNEHFEPGPTITVEGVNSLLDAKSNEEYEALDVAAKPLNPQQVPTFLVFDEFQEFAIKGGKNFPLGDDFFWAKNRSKGVIGIVAFQFKSSVEQFMGKDATTTMLGNMRNKIILHSEDVEFIQYMSQLCGKVRRHHVPTGYGYFESQAQKEISITQEMKAAGILDKGGAYPDISGADLSTYMDFVTKGMKISAGDGFADIAQHETLSQAKYDAYATAIYDDAQFTYRERLRTMTQNGGMPTMESLAGKMNETYHSLEREAMDQQSDYDEDLVTIERVINSRNCAIAYIQSYSGVIRDYYYVKQDHELKAERAEIHAEIAKQNNLQEVA